MMFEYKGYMGHVEFDNEANIFHGEIINIDDVITFQGRSIDELQKALKDSVEVYIEFCKEQKKRPDKPFGKFTVQLTPEQHRKVFIAAKKSGENLSEWVTHVLEDKADEAIGRV
jgi:predicted HicB family RNase H-like nuclease